jgi:molybdenum cofactor cytidylyltransferase
LQAALASQLQRIIIVVQQPTGEWLAPFSREQDTGRVQVAACPDARLGQAESLKCGLRALSREGADPLHPSGSCGSCDSFMILLADQPFLKTDIINRLLDEFAWLRGQGPIDYVAARWQNIPRPPVVFSLHLMQELLQLTGDAGARKLLQRNSLLHGRSLDFTEHPLSFLDIDTPEEYRSAVEYADKILTKE